MKRICIVGAMNIKHMSLITLYTKYFDDHGLSYDLIYMDRYGEDEKSTAQNKYCFKVKMDRDWNKGKKLLAYLKFRKYARNILLNNKYDLVITWQTFTAYLLADILLTKFKGRYIINVRDYIVENIPPIKNLLKLLVGKSVFTTISSEGFQEFLPKGNYVRVNSINEELLQLKRNMDFFREEDRIKIGFVGNCRFFNENRLFIDSLKNDKRFEMWYCGTNSDIFQKYAQENNINNLFTVPTFEPEETTSIINKFDMVNSIFGNNDVDNRTLMPIRLYTAVELEIPLIVSSGTQLSKEVNENKFGFSISNYQNLGDQIFDYIRSLNSDEFSVNCSRYMEKSRRENKIFIDKLKDVIN